MLRLESSLRIAIQFGPYKFTVAARRTKHLRFNNLKDPEEIPLRYALLKPHRIRRPNRGATHTTQRLGRAHPFFTASGF